MSSGGKTENGKPLLSTTDLDDLQLEELIVGAQSQSVLEQRNAAEKYSEKFLEREKVLEKLLPTRDAQKVKFERLYQPHGAIIQVVRRLG